jgi:hypothetical protein
VTYVTPFGGFMANEKTKIKQEKEECACEKLNLCCPFIEINGKQDCQGCVFKVHTVKEIQEIILSHYL